MASPAPPVPVPVPVPAQVFPVSSPDSHRRTNSNSSVSSSRPLPSPKPNPHPYAIKTTSTALLTRSNSSGHNPTTSYHYVPASPSPTSSRVNTHRHNRSINLESPTETSSPGLPQSPRPLPVPPSPSTPARLANQFSGYKSGGDDDSNTPPWRVKRDTVSSSTPTPEASPVKIEDLPPNPKIWTPAQLSSYLTNSLRVKSGESLSLPLPVVRDITAFVRESRLGGRAFLRLTESDLEEMGINHLWRNALLDASRSLRQNVLKGRIWGFGNTPEPDTTSSPNNSPYKNVAYSSSSSSVDLSGDEMQKPKNGYRNGRVRGMVETFERSASFSSHEGSGSEGVGIPVGPWVDEDAIVSESEDEGPGKPRDAKPLPKRPASSPEDEPDMATLLASSGKSGSWGAKAWEDMDAAPGITVKRIVNIDDADGSGAQTTRPGSGHSSKRGRGSSRKSLPKDDKRPTVTDIFSPTPEVAAVDEERAEKEDEMMRQTRSLLDQFRARLEEVELKLEIMEKRDAERERKEQAQREQEREERARARKSSISSPTSLVPRAFSYLYSGRGRGLKDPTPASLPSYVILVGIGMCAVILRVMLRKLAGRKGT